MPYKDRNNATEFQNLLKKESTNENANKIGKMFGFIDVRKNHDIAVIISQNGALDDTFEKAGFHRNGDNRQYSVFLTWLMGAKGLSIEEAMNLGPDNPDFQNYVNDFTRFLVDHPVKGVSTEDSRKNTKAWTELYLKCAKKINDFKFPDIDYSDPEQVAQHSDILGFISYIQIDMTQEFEMLTADERKEYAEEAAGGSQQLREGMAPWYALETIALNLKHSYIPEKFNSNVIDSMKRNNYGNLLPIINSRLGLKEFGKKFAGKTLKEYSNEALKANQNKELYKAHLTATQARLSKSPYKKEEMLDYLMGYSKDIEKTYESTYARAINEAREYVNSGEIQAGAKELQRQVHLYSEQIRSNPETNMIAYVFGDLNDPKPEEMLKTLKSDQCKDLNHLLVDGFEKLTNYSIVSVDFMKAAGIKDPLSIIKINGKTAEELWGSKYSKVSKEDKEYLLKAEIVREMIYGNSKITVDVYAIDKNDQMVQTKPFTLAESNQGIVQTFPFFRAVNNLHEKLDTELKTLLETQDDPEKNIVNGKGTEGSAEYRAMLEALKKCVECTDLTKNTGGMKELGEAMSNLKKASAKYYKSHTSSLFKGYTKNKGKVRVNSDNTFKGDFLTTEYGMLKELYALTDIEPSELMHRPFETTKFKEGFEKMQEMCKSRGTTLGMDRVNAPNHLADKIFEFSDRKKNLRYEVLEASKGLRTQTEKATKVINNMDMWKGKDAIGYAKKIVKDEFFKFIKDASAKSDITLDELETAIMDESFADKFHAKVDSVLNDQKFLSLLEKDPATCIAKYKAIQKTRNENYHSFMKENSEAYNALSLKYADPTICEFKWTQAEKQLSDWQKQMNLEEDNITSIRAYAMDEENRNCFEAKDVKEGTDLSNNPELSEKVGKLNYIKDTLSDIITLSIMKDDINKAKDKTEAGMMKAINPKEFNETKKLVKKSIEADKVLFSRDSNTFATSLTLGFENLKFDAKKFVEAEKAKEANKGKKMDEPKKGANKGAAPKAPNK